MKNSTLALITGLILLFTACSKSKDEPYQQPKTPLHDVVGADYIWLSGDNTITVDYQASKPDVDLDKKMLDAAIATIKPPYDYSMVIVKGKNLTSRFKNGEPSQPSSFSFNVGSQYYKDINAPRTWKGKLIVIKNNKLVSAADFDKGVTFQVWPVNTDDKVKTSRAVSDDVIAVTFEVTSDNPQSTLAANYIVQSNIDVTFKLEYEMDLKNLYGFNLIGLEPSKSSVKPTITNIGNNTTQYKGEVYKGSAVYALEAFLTSWYYREYVVPQLR